MAIEMINAQNKIMVSPVSGVLNTGSGEISARAKHQTPDNRVVQLFPIGRKQEAENIELGAEQVSAMVEDLQASLEMLRQKNTHLNFSVHEETDRVVVRIKDQNTGDVIREIPSEEFLNLAAKLQEMVGLMFDMKV